MCRRATPAAGHHTCPPEDTLAHSANHKSSSPVAAVVDVPCTIPARQHTVDSRSAAKPGASQALTHRQLSEQLSSDRNTDASRVEQQRPAVRFDASSRGAELRDLRAASSLDACDMMSEGSGQNSNMHGSISLAGSAFGADDVGSSVHNGSISVCMHGDTCDGDVGGQVTQRISAAGGIRSRPGVKQRRKGPEERLLLQYDAGLRMAMALQAESQGGMLPQVAVRGSVRLQRSKAFVTDCKVHSRLMAWRAT